MTNDDGYHMVRNSANDDRGHRDTEIQMKTDI